MRILWGRVIAAAFGVVVLVLLIKDWHAIVGFLKTTEHIGPGHTREEQMLGLIAFGLICVLIVALVKILTHANGK